MVAAAGGVSGASPATPITPPADTAALASRNPLDDARETVTLRIAHALQDGSPNISIDLHPAELGHVGVHLSFHDGGVSIQMTMSSRQTYDTFTRDRSALEQQLSQSGINLGSGGLNLRFGNPQDQARPGTSGTASRFSMQPQDAAPIGQVGAVHLANGLVNILA